MRILMIANSLPYPMVSGDRIRNYNLLRRVANLHEVSLAAFLESPEDIEGISQLQQFCAAVETAGFPERSRLAKVAGMLRYAAEGKPPDLNLLYSEELVEKIRQLVAGKDFDIVQIDTRMGLYLETLPKNLRRKSILMFADFTLQQSGRISKVEQNWYRKLRRLLLSVTMGYWETRYAEKYDRCTTVSVADQQLLVKANPRLQVDVIPNGVDIEKYQPLALPPEDIPPYLMFIGHMGYPPCVDAMLFFCREIFPFIRHKIDLAELWIVGRDPRQEVLELDGNGVHVTGRVEDVVPYYQQSAVCVVPLRAGGGTRLKILEAMALGRPVVSTTIGCEGLDVVDNEHLLIADEPKQFAEKTVRLLADQQLYQHIATEGRKLVVRKYDWNIIADRMMQIYNELANP
jgi:polysaccharide biosynthesis protein PslH